MMKFKEFRNARLVNISDEVYFSEEYSEYISNSKLGLLNPAEGGSYEKFLNGFSNSKASYFAFGDAVHKVMLEGYKISNVSKPTEKIALINEYLASNGYDFDDEDGYREAIIEVDYYKGKFNQSRYESFKKDDSYYRHLISGSKDIVLTDKIKNNVNDSIASLNANQNLMDLFNGPGDIHNESAALCDAVFDVDGKEYIVPMKCKFDRYVVTDDDIMLIDVKTSSGGYYKFGGYEPYEIDNEDINDLRVIGTSSFHHWHYFRQMAMYSWILKTIYPKKNLIGCYMVVVGSGEDKTSGVYRVPEEYLEIGETETIDLLTRVLQCQLYGEPKKDEVEDLNDLINMFS